MRSVLQEARAKDLRKQSSGEPHPGHDHALAACKPSALSDNENSVQLSFRCVASLGNGIATNNFMQTIGAQGLRARLRFRPQHSGSGLDPSTGPLHHLARPSGWPTASKSLDAARVANVLQHSLRVVDVELAWSGVCHVKSAPLEVAPAATTVWISVVLLPGWSRTRRRKGSLRVGWSHARWHGGSLWARWHEGSLWVG